MKCPLRENTPIVFSIVEFPLRVCIKARWVGPYVFNRVRADLQSPTSLKDVLLVKALVFHDLSELTPAFSYGLV